VPLGEFEVISRYFSRASGRSDVLLGVGDDAALLQPPAGQALVALEMANLLRKLAV
jgi:thiamine-monophosphate kinase